MELSHFGDIVFDTLTRLLQEGEKFTYSRQVVAEDRRLPERTMCRLLKRVVESGLMKYHESSISGSETVFARQGEQGER